jgi:hypothetical protein
MRRQAKVMYERVAELESHFHDRALQYEQDHEQRLARAKIRRGDATAADVRVVNPEGLAVLRKRILYEASIDRATRLHHAVRIQDDTPVRSAVACFCSFAPDEEPDERDRVAFEDALNAPLGTMERAVARMIELAIGRPPWQQLRTEVHEDQVNRFLEYPDPGHRNCVHRFAVAYRSGCPASTYEISHDLLPASCYEPGAAERCNCPLRPPRGECADWLRRDAACNQAIHLELDRRARQLRRAELGEHITVEPINEFRYRLWFVVLEAQLPGSTSEIVRR